MSGKMNICGPRALSLSENGEGQLPHFVANRSGLLCTVADTAQAGLASLFNVDSAASPGNLDALIRAEAMRTVILLMSGLQNASCCKETYISAGLSSIPRGLFRVRL
jgi:hypothetical protein